MSWFGELISSAGSSLVNSVGDAIDKNVTSDEERLTLKNEMARIVAKSNDKMAEHAGKLEQEFTERHKTDMSSDSWLSKNIRPMALVFLTVMTVALAYFSIFSTLTTIQLDTLKVWEPLLKLLLLAAYGFYFGGRSIEKVAKLKK